MTLTGSEFHQAAEYLEIKGIFMCSWKGSVGYLSIYITWMGMKTVNNQHKH